MTLVLAVLLAVLGSLSVALTLAALVKVPATLEVRTRVTWAVAFSAKLPKLHENIPLATPQVPWLVLLETNAVFGGKVSDRLTLLAAFSPAFKTLSV